MSAAARPTVSVFAEDGSKTDATVPLPAVFTVPIRPDVINDVHTSMAKNKRQAYAVAAETAGMQTAAESWGTGRAVSRIPRVPGGGTHRAGQAAFGNMCRGGRMYNPTRVWRRWHRKISKNQRRFAVSSALAASAVTPLVMARGHRVDQVPELPLVVGGNVESVSKTEQAIKVLTALGAEADLEKSKSSKKVRAGKGKMRNRRYVLRRGPLVIHAEDAGIARAVRNLPGVETVHVDRLNLLQLAPGGHIGRFCVWTQGAFEKLDQIFGTYTEASSVKNGFVLPRSVIANADLNRLINSDEVQKVVRAAKTERTKTLRKKNPLKNLGVMVKLNPYALAHRRAELRAAEARKEKKAAKKAKKTGNSKAARRQYYENMLTE